MFGINKRKIEIVKEYLSRVSTLPTNEVMKLHRRAKQNGKSISRTATILSVEDFGNHFAKLYKNTNT